MRNILIIVLCLVSEFDTVELIASGEINRKSFNDAVVECENQGLELLTMSTYRQYLEAQNYFNTHLGKESWLALEQNATIDNYQWLNGRVLTELKWKSGEPVDYTGTDCGVMDVYYKRWYSKPCTDSRHYLCVGSDGNYSVGSVSVDFYTAVLNCQSEGRRLPVAITTLDTNWLNDVISNKSLRNDIWLGLLEYGTQPDDYFKWVTGEDLTPPYKWADSDRYPRVHYHHSGSIVGFHSSSTSEQEVICLSKPTETAVTGEDLTPPYKWADSDRYPRVHYHHSGSIVGFHSSSTSEQEIMCLSKPTETAAVVRSPDKFVFVSNNAIVLGSLRRATTTNSLRRFQCALECLQDTGCIQYTIQGYLCRTFGESLFIINYSRGHMLWQRKIIS